MLSVAINIMMAVNENVANWAKSNEYWQLFYQGWNIIRILRKFIWSMLRFHPGLWWNQFGKQHLRNNLLL